MSDPSPLLPSEYAIAASYKGRAESYDELKADDGSVRLQWRRLLDQVQNLPRGELARRWERARHLIHENGVSYNVYGDPNGLERPWSLSPVPVLISPEDWTPISQGLAQRARMLDALLADLYGPQRSLLEGWLPPDLVFENPWFLRPCHGQTVPRGAWLPLYCADLVRARDGRFRVIEDRTQVPSGAGYALENRIVISSVLPEAFRECNVERLALFFRALRTTLHNLAPHNRDNPRIVVLTPGPYNATYFEQAYLAQYLGYTLANGSDLTVRDDRVYLKTLGGLQPVDVILRRVNDDYCDPLELRPESVLGVPGLVHAARMGNVAVASPLGTGMLQTPAMLPYLPKLCRHLLGEDLALEAVRTFWCGDAKALAEAEQHFSDAIVKPTFPERFVEPLHTAKLTVDQRSELWAKIRARPRDYVIQEHVPPSTTPVIVEGEFTPRALVMRCYAVSGNGEYVVMPGGLSRVATAADGTEISMQLGAGSKDTWVISNEPVSNFSLLAAAHRAVELSRGGSDLPSRAADNLYWLGRYAERAEAIARLARVLYGRLFELAGQRDLERSSEFVALLRALTVQADLSYALPLPTDEVPALDQAEKQLVSAVFDAERVGTLAAVVRATLRTGRLVRDRISTDTWRVLASLDEDLSAAEKLPHADRLTSMGELLNRVVQSLSAFSGLVMESMTRGHAWRFLDMGRRLERAMTLVMLLRSTLTRGCEREGPLLEAVLEIADSSMTYRRRYLATLEAAPVVDLLLTDETNPRSVIYQFEALANHIAALPPRGKTGVRSAEQRIALGALKDLELAEVDPLCKAKPDGTRPLLDELLRDLIARIPALSDALSDGYLNHATVSRHLSQDENSERRKLPFGGDP